MEIIELGRLEMQIDRLMCIVEKLRSENTHLRSLAARHAREKSAWFQQNRETIGKIKKIISHLREASA